MVTDSLINSPSEYRHTSCRILDTVLGEGRGRPGQRWGWATSPGCSVPDLLWLPGDSVSQGQRGRVLQKFQFPKRDKD